MTTPPQKTADLSTIFEMACKETDLTRKVENLVDVVVAAEAQAHQAVKSSNANDPFPMIGLVGLAGIVLPLIGLFALPAVITAGASILPEILFGTMAVSMVGTAVAGVASLVRSSVNNSKNGFNEARTLSGKAIDELAGCVRNGIEYSATPKLDQNAFSRAFNKAAEKYNSYDSLPGVSVVSRIPSMGPGPGSVAAYSAIDVDRKMYFAQLWNAVKPG